MIARTASGAVGRIGDRFDRFVRFARTPAPPVLAPYHQPRAPLHEKSRSFVMMGLLVFVGMLYGFFYALLPPFFLMFMLAPIAVIALIVIWALPDRDTAPTVALERIYWGFWLSMILWPNYLALALPGLPWITVNRLFGGPMLLLLLVCVSTSAPFRAELMKPISTSPLVWKLLAGFVVAQTGSVFFSSELSTTVNRVINLQLVWTSVFVVSAFVFLKPGRIERWASLFCIMAVIISLIGLAEAHVQHVLWAQHIPSFLKVEDIAVQRALTAQFRAGDYRVLSTFMSALSLSEFLALSSPFLIHIFVISKEPLTRMACAAADLLVLTVIVFTQARLGLVGFILGHSIYALFWSIRRWRTDRASILGPALTLAYPAILATVFLVIMSVTRLRVRVFGGSIHQASNDAREVQFEMAPSAILRSPVFGHGAGQGSAALGYTNAGGEGSIDSYILSIALDYGIVGFVCFYGMIAAGFYKAAGLATRETHGELGYALPVAITLVVFMTIKIVLSQESNNTIMFMMLGMVVAMSYRSQQARGGVNAAPAGGGAK